LSLAKACSIPAMLGTRRDGGGPSRVSGCGLASSTICTLPPSLKPAIVLVTETPSESLKDSTTKDRLGPLRDKSNRWP
jgi:hypothetical protein